MNIEKEIEKLDALVARLENETLSIDDSLALFNEAIESARICLAGIKEGKGRLELLKDAAERLELELDDEKLR
jgi:exodeoxyribonuclease VII small subunit